AQVFAYARGQFGLSCSAASAVAVGLFIDGQPLDGSGNNSLSSNGTSQHLELFGTTSGLLPAGDHTLSVDFDCVTSSFTTGSFGGDGAVGVIALGLQPGTLTRVTAKREPTRRVITVHSHAPNAR